MQLNANRDEWKKIEDDFKNLNKTTGFVETENKNIGNSTPGTETPEQRAAREAREAAA